MGIHSDSPARSMTVQFDEKDHELIRIAAAKADLKLVPFVRRAAVEMAKRGFVKEGGEGK